MRVRLLIVLLAISLTLPQTAAALGFSPANIELFNLTNTSTVTREFNISRKQPDNEDSLKLTISGSGASAVVEPAEQITLPSGAANVPYNFTLQPDTFDPGTYTVYFTFTLDESVNNEATPVVINPAVETVVNFSVTEETIENYTIQSVEMGNNANSSTVNFSYVLVNDGNVETRPDHITITLVDALSPDKTYTETITAEQLPLVPAFAEGQIVPYETSLTNLPPALYNVTITFYDQNNETVFTTDTLHWQVMPTTQFTNSINYWLGLIGAGCAILAVGLLTWFIKKRHVN